YPGDDAVAEEPHDPAVRLVGGGLADRQVLGDAALLGGELDAAVGLDIDHADCRAGDLVARRVEEGAVVLDLLAALLRLGRDRPVAAGAVVLPLHPVEAAALLPAEVEPGRAPGGLARGRAMDDLVFGGAEAGGLRDRDRRLGIGPAGGEEEDGGPEAACSHVEPPCGSRIVLLKVRITLILCQNGARGYRAGGWLPWLPWLPVMRRT